MQNNLRPVGFSILPTVVKNLLIINGLCFLINVVMEERFGYSLNQKLGLYYPGSELFKPYQLITHIFMHGSFMHLFFNMFSLWMFGSVIENYWGPKRFFIYYFVTGFGAAALHMGVNAYEIHQIRSAIAQYAANPNVNDFMLFIQDHKTLLYGQSAIAGHLQEFTNIWSSQPGDVSIAAESVGLLDIFAKIKMNIPVVGASGAVYGLLLAFGMMFPNALLMMLFLPIPIKAKYFVMIYGALELIQGIRSNPGDNVAHFAHLGGMLFGFILIKIWNKTRRDTFY